MSRNGHPAEHWLEKDWYTFGNVLNYSVITNLWTPNIK